MQGGTAGMGRHVEFPARKCSWVHKCLLPMIKILMYRTFAANGCCLLFHTWVGAGSYTDCLGVNTLKPRQSV